MSMGTASVMGLRIVSALAVVVFGVLALNRSTADVTFTFPASGTTGLAEDVEFRCGTAPTSFDVSAGGVRTEFDDAYDEWALAHVKETGAPPDTSGVEIAACEAARDSRLIALVWLVAGALASGVVLLGALVLPARRTRAG